MISQKLIEILKVDLPKDYLALDVGGLNFTITFKNKKRLNKTLMVPDDYFKSLFDLIKPIIPQSEELPSFMIDYEEEECEEAY